MPYNRIAIYGHRGWASSIITKALIASGASVKILHRPSSDVSHLPSHVEKIEVDVENGSQLISALKDVDILISLVGQPAIGSQFALIETIPQTEVKLFVPSELGSNPTEQQRKIKALNAKEEVFKVAQAAKIPTTLIWPGSLVESSFATLLLGIDIPGNQIVYVGDSENQYLNVCSVDYVAAAYVDIFSSTPIEQIANRVIRLCEFRATGSEIAQALHQKHGTPPRVFRQSLATVEQMIDTRLAKGDMTAIALSYRHPWGEQTSKTQSVEDVWDVKSYNKTTLDEVVVEGKLGDYKELPPPFVEGLKSTFTDD